MAENNQYSKYLGDDELRLQQKGKKAFHEFTEAPICFDPFPKTRKDGVSISKDSFSYPDRILYNSDSRLKIDAYTSHPEYQIAKISPVSFQVTMELTNSFLLKTISSLSEKRKSSVDKSLETNSWDITDFEFKETISINKFRCIHRYSRREYCAKILEKEYIQSDKSFNEMKVLQDVNSNFIIKYHKTFTLNDSVVMIHDLLDYETLNDYFKRKGKLDETEARFIICQLILALKEIQKKNIIHGDIKSANIKFQKTGYIKLEGFYFSKSIKIPIKKNMKQFLGSDIPNDLAVFKGSKEIDYYDLGMLTFELLSGFYPYINFNNSQINDTDYPSHFSSDLKSFIVFLTSRNVKSIEEIMNQNWIKKIDWIQLEKMEIKSPMLPQKTNFLYDGSESVEKLLKTLPKLKEENTPEPSPSLFKEQKNLYGRIRNSSGEFHKEDLVKIIKQDDEFYQILSNDIVYDIPSDSIEPMVRINDKYIAKKFIDVLNEFIITEVNYVKNLEVIIEHFLQPLSKIVSLETTYKIFSSIQTIYKVNSSLLENLQNAILEESYIDAVEKVLLNDVKAFKLYTSYIQNYNTSVSTIHSEKLKNSKFSNFLILKYKELSEMGIYHDIHSLLIMPIQRLPRYELLCQDLLRNTPQDKKELMETVTHNIKSIVSYCNEKNKEYELSLQVFQLHRSYNLPIDNSDKVLFEKKSSELIFYLDQNQKMIAISEFVLLSKYMLIELKNKSKIVIEWKNFKEVKHQEYDAFEFRNDQSNVHKIVFKASETSKKFKKSLKNKI